MKVLLLNPPRDNELIGNNPLILEKERGFNPPLGLLYVAAYLERFTKHTVSVIDSQVERLDYHLLASRINSVKPAVIGLTAMTFTLIDVIKTVDLIKRIDKSIKIVLGGPHIHLFPGETINLTNVDYLVLGEGEETFKELLERLGSDAELKKVPGLVFKDRGAIIHTGNRALIKNLNDIPFPARHLVPYKKYNSLLTKGNTVTTVFTSRGCPFQCSFCDRPHLGKIFRARSANNVVDELQECVKMGISEFLIYDDTFTVNKQRVLDICNEITKRKLDIAFDIRTRIDTVDKEILGSLKKAGCQGIHYGVESGTEKVLRLLNKCITLNQVKEVFTLTKQYSIPILAYFMIGNPGETIEDIWATFALMKALDPDYAHITIFTPFPGTKIYIDGLRSGIIKHDYWREFASNPTDAFAPPQWGERFSREELNDLLIKGYKSFYLRPSYMLKRTLKIRSVFELHKKIKAGIKVLMMGRKSSILKHR